jgi:NAD(P)-dependent dehydrogenase (short-subunit alcohol dehydrogenase family)
MGLNGKTAIITGGAQGIGRETARTLAAEGVNVSIGDINQEPKGGGVPTHEVIKEQGQDSLFRETDVSNADDCRRLVEDTVDAFGSVDILVNNAGLFPSEARGKTVAELSVDEWRQIIEINLDGAFNCSKFAIPHIVESDAGRVINVSSKMCMVGHPESSAYSSAKGGIITLTKQMAIDFAPDAVTVNAICPGIIETGTKQYRFDQKGDRMREQTPLPYLGTAEDIANAARFLASPDARFITGHALVVDGGWTAQ